MVDLAAVSAAMPGTRKFGPDPKRGLGQTGDVGAFDCAWRAVGQEEPITTPRHIARNGPETVDGDFQASPMDIAQHVLHGGFVATVKLDGYDPDGRLEPVDSRTNATHARERHCGADGPVTAHAKKTGVVEEDEPRRATRIGGLAKQSADHGVEPTWFVERKSANVVVPLRKKAAPLGEGSSPERGASL